MKKLVNVFSPVVALLFAATAHAKIVYPNVDAKDVLCYVADGDGDGNNSIIYILKPSGSAGFVTGTFNDIKAEAVLGIDDIVGITPAGEDGFSFSGHLNVGEIEVRSAPRLLLIGAGGSGEIEMFTTNRSVALVCGLKSSLCKVNKDIKNSKDANCP